MEEGIVWGRMLFENNSKYPIRRLEITTDVESLYGNFFGHYMTVMPGEVSSMSVSPTKPDMKVTGIKYIVFDRGTNYEITYDVASDHYSQIEELFIDMDRVKKAEVAVLADFDFSYTTDPPDGILPAMSHITYVNNTDATIEHLSVDMIDPKKQILHTFAHFESIDGEVVLPGATSHTFTSFGSFDLEVVAVGYSAIINDKKYLINYDYKIDVYHQFELPIE